MNFSTKASHENNKQNTTYINLAVGFKANSHKGVLPAITRII